MSENIVAWNEAFHHFTTSTQARFAKKSYKVKIKQIFLEGSDIVIVFDDFVDSMEHAEDVIINNSVKTALVKCVMSNRSTAIKSMTTLTSKYPHSTLSSVCRF